MSGLDTSQALEPMARAWLPRKRQFPLLLTMQRTYAFGANSCRLGPGFGYNPSTIFRYPTLIDSLPELVNKCGWFHPALLHKRLNRIDTILKGGWLFKKICGLGHRLDDPFVGLIGRLSTWKGICFAACLLHLMHILCG